MNDASAVVVSFRDLTLGYDRHPAVHHLDGVVTRGSATAVIGPNGAGKSTLLKGIGGLIRPLGGTVRLHGLDARDIAHLPQAAEIDRSFPISVFEFVSLGLWRRVGIFGGLGRDAARRVGEALEAVGLVGFETRPIGALSGGQMQRTLFARLLVQDAAVILLDEPFNAVDRRTTDDLAALVGRWHGEGRTIVAVLHDLDLARRLCPQAILLARELVAAGPIEEVANEENLARARALVDAFDGRSVVCHRPAA